MAVTTNGVGNSGTADATDTIENLERDTLGASWLTALEAELGKPYFRKVRRGLHAHIVPALKNLPAQRFSDFRTHIACSIPTR
jgi:hypothetical protein